MFWWFMDVYCLLFCFELLKNLCLIIFQKLKEAERQRIGKLEELDRKANVQLERQLVMASNWSRALLGIRGKLKGTEWDPENSHRIHFSDFLKLLDSNNVQFMEYSNYGQTVSGRGLCLIKYLVQLYFWLFMINCYFYFRAFSSVVPSI